MVLDKNKLSDIVSFLRDQQLLEAGETVISADKAGEGNMNYVLRIELPNRSLIIKQARPYVEKYPTIPAPEERAIIEGEFYKQIATNQVLKAAMPSVVRVDEANHIIVLEDLGHSNDYTFLYKQGSILSQEEAESLSTFLSVLHSNYKSSEHNELMANRKLRALNHQHIFLYPLMIENGFDLNTIQPGLQELSIPLKKNEHLKQIAEALGDIYLKDGSALLHGDFYPGSWLKTSAGIKIIDPEFCFYGPAEFDLAVMLAHLMLAGQADTVLKTVIAHYKKQDDFNDNLLQQFTGIEVVRRIIGLAQLPLQLSLEEKQGLLNKALRLLNI